MVVKRKEKKRKEKKRKEKKRKECNHGVGVPCGYRLTDI